MQHRTLCFPSQSQGDVSPRTVEALLRCEVLEKVPMSVLPSIVNSGNRKEFKSGDRVVAAGNRSESMFIVLSGSLACEVLGVVVRTLGGGESFGEIAVFAYRTWKLHKEHAELVGNSGALESL